MIIVYVDIDLAKSVFARPRRRCSRQPALTCRRFPQQDARARSFERLLIGALQVSASRTI